MLWIDRLRSELSTTTTGKRNRKVERDVWRAVGMELRPDLVRRFLAKVDRKPFECWLWSGGRNQDGYGVFSEWDGRRYTHHGAHRLMFEIAVGRLEPGQLVLHSCDNPACVNPIHLRAGSHQDNENDKCSRGRQAKGERNHFHKLTAEQVAGIRESRQTLRATARAYGVSVTQVFNIKHHRHWR